MAWGGVVWRSVAWCSVTWLGVMWCGGVWLGTRWVVLLHLELFQTKFFSPISKITQALHILYYPNSPPH